MSQHRNINDESILAKPLVHTPSLGAQTSSPVLSPGQTEDGNKSDSQLQAPYEKLAIHNMIRRVMTVAELIANADKEARQTGTFCQLETTDNTSLDSRCIVDSEIEKGS